MRLVRSFVPAVFVGMLVTAAYQWLGYEIDDATFAFAIVLVFVTQVVSSVLR